MMRPLIFLASFSLSIAHALGPIFVGSGSGESEFALSFVAQNLPNFLAFCDNQVCALSPRGEAAFRALSQRARKLPSARFVAFARGDLRRFSLATTGSEVFFSRDRLWRDDAKSIPLDEPAAALLWLEVLADEKPVLDPRSVSEISCILESAWRSRFTRTTQSLQPEGRVTAVLLGKDRGDDQLFIMDENKNSVELASVTRADDRCADGSAPRSSLSSPRWIAPLDGSPTSSLRFDVLRTLRCAEGSRRARLTFLVRFTPDGHGKTMLVKNSVQLLGEEN